jgi:hypothetical protein
MMKIAKNKIGIITILMFLMLSMSASTILLPNASAHNPPQNIPTYAFCNVAPNPAGVGQSVNVGFWLASPPPTAGTIYGDRWNGMMIEVTLPDGTNTTLGPFSSDDTGGTHVEYTPNTPGNYTFQMSYPGQTLAGINPPPVGFSAAAKAYIGDNYQSSISNVATLTVQQEPIPLLPQNPLPTNYWTRPIQSVNDNWYSISGNWLGLGALFSAATGMYNATGNYNPYTTAPTTAHIMWTKPEAFGGLIGGEFGGTDTSNYYSTRQYERMFQPIIMNGVLYYEEYPGSSLNPTGWAAVNLQTGQTLWTKDANNYGGGSSAQTALTISGLVTTLRCGQTLNYVTPNQYGALAYLWSTGTPAGINSIGTTWNMFDAMTGSYVLSIVNGTALSPLIEDDGGDLIGYYVNATAGTQIIQGLPVTTPSGGAMLECWNSTQDILVGTNGPAAWQWRPTQNGQIPFASGIMWAMPIATNISGASFPSTLALPGGTYSVGAPTFNSGVLILNSIASTGGPSFNSGFIIEAGYDANTGQQLWITNRTETPYTRVDFSQTSNGVFVEINQDTAVCTAYSVTTGTKLWGPITLPNVDPYNSVGSYYGQVANDTLYLSSFGGDIYAINIQTGTILWQTNTNSISGAAGSDTPYGVWPIWQFGNPGAIADGMLFLGEGHEYSPPLFRGASQLAINLTNGKPVWSIMAFDVDGGTAISDGVMVAESAYDNQIYAYGMGPSKTTVTAPSVGVTTSTPITITGTVTDISAGSQQEASLANFPNGLPCVSDSSMTQFMEAVYEQQPMPANATGVPVTINVLDSNNNYRTIGTVTSNIYGTYSLSWTPDIAGNYTVIANFAGTNSYYPSTASTAFYANVASATSTSTIAPQTNAATSTEVLTYIVAAAIAIIIAIAIIGLLLLRKKP